jgi:surface protein
MFIGSALSVSATPATAQDGLVLPQPAGLPMVSGDAVEGATLTADTTDTWTHGGAPASVTARSYQLLVDAVPTVAAQASPSVDLPADGGGAVYLMHLRVQVAEAPGLWSPWLTIASGTIAALPRLSGVLAQAAGPDSCTAEVTTDTGSGTLYWDVTEAPTPPTDLKTGAGSQPVATSGPQTITVGGLTPDTTYYVHFVQSDGTGHDSAPVSSLAFTTDPAALVPEAFGAQDWSIADAGTGGDAILTIAALPFAGAAAISGIDWRIGTGAWITLGAATPGSYTLTDRFTDGTPSLVSLRAVNLIGPSTASNQKEVTTTLQSGGSTGMITHAAYAPGGGGTGPSLNLTLDQTGTIGPYTFFLATHATGTTLSKPQIETGTGDAADAVFLSDGNGVVSGEALTLSTSLTNGHMSVFVRDGSGTPVESAVTKIDAVDVDATAPVIAQIDITNITGGGADWRIFTNETGGVIHVRVRAASAAAYTAAEIIENADDSDSAVGFAGDEPSLYGARFQPGLVALWDALDVTDGPVGALPDLSGPFDLTAIAAPTAAGGIITFDGTDDVLTSAAVADTGAPLPGAAFVAEYTLPDALGGDPGQGFSIAGLAHDDADGTWWAANGGLNYDGSSANRRQSIVHLSADFSTNLAEIDLDAVLPTLDANDESPQAVAVDNANGWLWVGDPTAQAIRCFDKATLARIPANDIARSYDIGSLSISEDGRHLWVMSQSPGDATIQKISTDGLDTVSVDITLDLDNRHDHLCEKDGVLYIACGTNGAQAFVTAVDPVQGIALGRAMLPYPGNAEGLVGLEGIHMAADGAVFIAHNGYFHYGDPDNPAAPLTWPRKNIVTEYTLPVLASRDVDLFALVDLAPTYVDTVFQFGSALDAVKRLPALGLFVEQDPGAVILRKAHAGAGSAISGPTAFDGPMMIYVTVRDADVTIYINGEAVATGPLGSDGLGLWGPAREVEFGASDWNGNRHVAGSVYAAGAILGGAPNRADIELTVATRHGLQALLQVPPAAATDFVMTIETTVPGESFTIPCQDLGGFDASIDWGDGGPTSAVTAWNDPDLTHVYATPGVHTVSVSGTFPNLYFNNAGDAAKLRTVESLGTVGWQTLERAFYGCSGLTAFDGSGDVSGVTSLAWALADCAALTTVDLSSWDVSNVTDMLSTFRNCPALTTIGLSAWNTSAVTNMEGMFFGCTSLSGFDPGGWNITGLDSNNDLNNWFRDAALSTPVYDALLIAWEAQGPRANLKAHFGNSQFTQGGAAAAARAALINDRGWVLTDAGAFGT